MVGGAGLGDGGTSKTDILRGAHAGDEGLKPNPADFNTPNERTSFACIRRLVRRGG